jgi:hypothetical protein
MVDVDPLLGDIDADEGLGHGHGACPCPAGLAGMPPLTTVQVRSEAAGEPQAEARFHH